MRIEGDSYDEILGRLLAATYNAQLAALSTLQANMLQRIHVDGQKSDSTQIGTYSTSWAARRRRKGLQVKYIDLVFYEDLYKSLITGTSEGNPVLGFGSSEQLEKAQNLTSLKGNIWEPNQSEIDDLINAFEVQLTKELNDTYQSR